MSESLQQTRCGSYRYEVVDPIEAHPELNAYLDALPKRTQLRILDMGAGSGRDAAWLAQLGQDVTAVEPSGAMRRLAQHLHPATKIRWLPDELPKLAQVGSGIFDLIVLTAVWMHVRPEDQVAALQRLKAIR
ncbi:class I SAM-dependent methyltransferase [Yoonia sp. 2307UL14-13]|uniref:class I SAM-dependent methyltransferase n=1 Tax=Yoonia sp. 2307UL14-13 TaxID=3126506 RepID=UPI0030A7FF10